MVQSGQHARLRTERLGFKSSWAHTMQEKHHETAEKHSYPHKKKHIFVSVVVLAVVIAGLLFYIDYSSKQIREDYNEKIAILMADLANAKNDLTAQINLLENLLENEQKENQQKILTLTSLIEEIEEKSNIQLTELKTELKNVQIKSADFSAIVNDVLESVVSVRTDKGQGSGAIIDERGYVVTNLHVINGVSRIEAYTYSKKTYDASIVGYDSAADIAVLKISQDNLKSLKFADSDGVGVGEKVIALGNPAGLDFTVTEGIISARRDASNGLLYFQTDVPLNPGNSGGPLVDKKGEIVGINNFKVGGLESLGFALASDDAARAVKNIMEQANVSYT